MPNRRSSLKTLAQLSGALLLAPVLPACTKDALEPELNLSFPNAGSVLCAGERVEIHWTSRQELNIRLEWSADNGANWSVIAENINSNQNGFSWALPSEAVEAAQLRVLWTDKNKVLAATEGNFSIQHPKFELASFQEEMELFSGDTYYIRWQSKCYQKVHVEYSQRGFLWERIAENMEADEQAFAWIVPEVNAQNAKIRILDAANNKILATSQEAIQITPQVKLNLADYPELQEVGGQLTLKDAPFWGVSIIRLSEEEFYALDLSCPHNGCLSEWKENGRTYGCYCHGQIFNSEGCAVSGPTELPLQEIMVTFDQDQQSLNIVLNRIPNRRCN